MKQAVAISAALLAVVGVAFLVSRDRKDSRKVRRDLSQMSEEEICEFEKNVIHLH